MIDEPMCATASWRHGEKLGQSFRSMRCIEPSGDTIASPPYIYNPNSRAAREQRSDQRQRRNPAASAVINGEYHSIITSAPMNVTAFVITLSCCDR